MIWVVPGVGSYTPIKELLKDVPHHVCDVIVEEPDKGYEINKEMIKSSVSFYKPKILFGKSYGSWLVSESISKNIPIFLFSIPLKEDKKVFGFPKIKNKNANLIYSSEDPYLDMQILKKNTNKYKDCLFLSGDHSLRPVTSDKILKIKEFILNSSGVKSFYSFLDDYLKKRKNARVTIINKTAFYEKVPIVQIKNRISNSLKFTLDENYGPITNVVKRKSPVGNIFVYQSNILDTSKINPLVKDSAATGGIGVSYNEKRAIEKSIFEALERYSLTLSIVDFVIKKYEEIPSFFKINKKELIFHTKKQKKMFNLKDAIVDEIHWTVIRNVLNHKEKLYPLQLIIPDNLGYMIRETSSSGTALGKTKEQALTHGLKESIERNSLMMWFYGLPEVKATKIVLNKKVIPKKFIRVYTTFHKKGFKFNAYLINFLGFNTFFIIAYDKSELYIGSSCGEFKEALSGALEEVIITSFFAKTLRGITPTKPDEIKNLPQHFLYYQKYLKFELLNYLDSLSKDKFKVKKSRFSYVEASKHLQRNGYEVYYNSRFS